MKVKIVGGGLTGILAAFEAHRLGVRDIELYERFDRLGGVALPEERHGLELREGCIYFGPASDPIRALLETYGQSFTEFENRFGSLSPADAGRPVHTVDFGGPAFACASTAVTPPAGSSLADRIAAYPSEIAGPLAKYAQWHLDADLADVHESAAIPMAINRVVPLGADVRALAEAKRRDPLADELLAIPRAQWGHTNNLTASLPEGGFPTFLRRCERALRQIGVKIHERNLVSPRHAIATHGKGEVLVWAANPTPLFKALDVRTPRLLPKSFSTYVFAARWTGPRPFYVQNFTAEGACFRAYAYESSGRTLVTAECVREADPTDLRYEVHRMLCGFEGDLALGEILCTMIKPRWIYHSVDAVQQLKLLRNAARDRLGTAFVDGAWEPYAKGEKFAQVNAALAAALGVQKGRAAA
ncbi:FAD/NAD(P)-binding protein [Phenylobacterium sp.]|uniref:NAD(P)-binding protein n=1 Tax=Phenylobacterium sp. TaxID=1871053 RepID=UPI0025D09634|nr:FAD/NAD(P)-binding protein [Phenylobacterium sp.]MBX3485338.1 NAD(P)/FAD-dependent oxidoreductase [Phenylobacterium sp.]MCW5759593.1 NAD(P)/FAD-dependent oxidoreductase [Phenylobacterium sp.]